MGNTDSRVYSFAAHTGALAWATGTGAYVYASAAVADVPGLGPDRLPRLLRRQLLRLQRPLGRGPLAHPAGGRISGSATIVGNVVYYSDLGAQHVGLDVAPGAGVLVPRRRVHPVIADTRIY